MGDLSVFILAGGRSSRMGRDKALLPFGDETLLECMLGKARHLTARPFIVGRRDLYSRYGEVIEDIIPGCGPLGGIHATLRSTETDLNLVLSVDIPKATPLFLRWMADTASNNDAVVTVPQANGRLQPLCAVYRRSALGAVEGELQAGNFKVTGVFAHLPTRVIAESELAAAGFALDMFDNVNTPADYNAVTGRQAQESAVRER